MKIEMSSSILMFLLSLTIAVTAVPQSFNDLDVNELQKRLKEIPGLETVNSSTILAPEQVDLLLKKKCEESGADNNTYDILKEHELGVKSCLAMHLNASQINEEIANSKPTGSMDEVFGKYCGKWPEIFDCVQNFTQALEPCLNEKEVDALSRTLNISAEIKEFLCHKDGDRIAMFIAEGGIECVEARRIGLQNCANKTFGHRIPTQWSMEKFPSFLISDKECSDMDEISNCISMELEQCQDSTTANIVDALLKFVRKQLRCPATERKFVAKKSAANPTRAPLNVAIHVIVWLSALFTLTY